MPVSYADALDEVCGQAKDKVATLRVPLRYAAFAALAGAYVGVGVVLLASIAGPLAAAGNPATKLVGGCVFGIALTLVVFAGADLFTGNNMVMLIGWVRGGVSAGAALVVNVATLAGNFVGAVAFAAAVHASGVLSVHTPGQPAPGDGMVSSLVAGKMQASDGQLFWRAVLCNALVCLGLWMATRTRSDAAKVLVLFWVLLAFVASGFEHSVANMTTFSLAIFSGAASWSDLAHNLLFTVPGNLLGGALVVGLPYAFSAERKMVTVEPEAAVVAPVAEPAPSLA
ncbi:MAG TPA: formate/nitrite transporter family protein [Jatrophihabitans sp.]|nr:formate/nitrite transporter family protein [Jatrophihabitans sp.]